MSINNFTSSRLCFGSTLENTFPAEPLRTFFFFSTLKFSNSAPVKHELAMFYPGTIMFNSCATATAVSLASPVIIMTLIPALRHS